MTGGCRTQSLNGSFICDNLPASTALMTVCSGPSFIHCSCLGILWKQEVKLSGNWLYSSNSATLNRTPSKEQKIYFCCALVLAPLFFFFLLFPLFSVLSPSCFFLSPLQFHFFVSFSFFISLYFLSCDSLPFFLLHSLFHLEALLGNRM